MAGHLLYCEAQVAHVLLFVRMLVEISGLLLGAALFGLSTAGYRMDSCNNATNETNGSTPASAFDEDYLDAAVRTLQRDRTHAPYHS